MGFGLDRKPVDRVAEHACRNEDCVLRGARRNARKTVCDYICRVADTIVMIIISGLLLENLYTMRDVNSL